MVPAAADVAANCTAPGTIVTDSTATRDAVTTERCVVTATRGQRDGARHERRWYQRRGRGKVDSKGASAAVQGVDWAAVRRPRKVRGEAFVATAEVSSQGCDNGQCRNQIVECLEKTLY